MINESNSTINESNSTIIESNSVVTVSNSVAVIIVCNFYLYLIMLAYKLFVN